MKRRKHRLYIDVTYSKPVGYRDAAKGLQIVIDDRLDIPSKPVWLYDKSPWIDKLSVVEIRP